jgi:small subunit ribosomal protein S8
MDQIANMLTQIRNAQAVGHKLVYIPYSNIKFKILEVLHKAGYLGSVSKEGRNPKKRIEVVLKYKNEKSNLPPAIEGSKRISKSGQRIYIEKKDLGKLLKERGVFVLSTSKGIMIAKEARKNGVGGEVLCKVW